MSIAIISSDKVVFALAFGLPIVVGALIVLWSRPRRWRALWALLSLAAILGVGIAAWAAFRGEAPGSTPAAIVAPAPSPTAPAPSATAPPSTVPPSASAPAQCQPSGTELHLTAAGIAFDPDCLAAPAETAFTIAFDNKDAGTPHNVHIFSADPAKDPNAQSLFAGDLVTRARHRDLPGLCSARGDVLLPLRRASRPDVRDLRLRLILGRRADAAW